MNKNIPETPEGYRAIFIPQANVKYNYSDDRISQKIGPSGLIEEIIMNDCPYYGGGPHNNFKLEADTMDDIYLLNGPIDLNNLLNKNVLILISEE